jgi:hypothetical protein
VYTGPDDPYHQLKADKRYRAFLPILVNGEVKVWSMSKTSHMQLLDIADAGGSLSGMELRIKRTGSGLATRYSVVPRGKRHDISDVPEVDIISMLGPITTEGVRKVIAEKLNKDSYEEVLVAYLGKAAFATDASKSAKKAGKVKDSLPVEDEDEDLDDIELI